ncbi:MAG: cytochrome c oxidase subunit 3 [Solirubrobacteraceae bacterium]|nr:cytochrome c oxidase subunit 3 [Solirubrobacteraceae bacterium]
MESYADATLPTRPGEGEALLVPPATDSDDKPVGAHTPGGGWEIWMFILGEMTIFVIMFGTFAYRRSLDPEAFYESQRQVHTVFGTTNAILLLTSSLFVVLAVQAVREGRRTPARRLILFGGACGVAFLLVKTVEWTVGISDGFTFNANEFASYYYVLCGLHVVHVVVGLVILAVVREHVARPEPSMQLVETGAIYWHMVDVLWIVLFALLFLVR